MNGGHGRNPSQVRARTEMKAGSAWTPCGRGLDLERGG